MVRTLPTSHEFPVLIGDIGGTNARFQIVESAVSEAVSFDTVRTEDYQTVEDAIARSVLNKTSLVPRTAILAAAGPITSIGIDLTNCDWSIDHSEFLKNGPFQELILMNDFEAQALALPYLEEADLKWLGGPKSLPKANRTKAVLGPGTGLGVASLVRADGKWIPVAGEGGHVDLGARTSREAEIWHHLETVEGRVSESKFSVAAVSSISIRPFVKLMVSKLYLRPLRKSQKPAPTIHRQRKRCPFFAFVWAGWPATWQSRLWPRVVCIWLVVFPNMQVQNCRKVDFAHLLMTNTPMLST